MVNPSASIQLQKVEETISPETMVQFHLKNILIDRPKYKQQASIKGGEILFCCKFWFMFLVFHLARSTLSTTKTFVAVEGTQPNWLIC